MAHPVDIIIINIVILTILLLLLLIIIIAIIIINKLYIILKLMNITEDRRGIFKDLRVNGGYTVDSVTSHNAQVRHINPSLSPLLNTRHTTSSVFVSWPLRIHLLSNRTVVASPLSYTLYTDIATNTKNSYSSCYRSGRNGA